MIFLKKKKKKAPNTAVKYEVREFIHGGIEYITDCPFGECGRYTHTINKVGALECNICCYQKKNKTEEGIVRCSHPIEQTNVNELLKK